MLESFLPQIPEILSHVWIDFQKHAEFQRFREAVIDRLKRNLKLNLEFWALSQYKENQNAD